MTTVRLSSEEVRVQSFIYGFTNSEVAYPFQTCLLFDALDDCEEKFSPRSRHSVCFESDDFE
jgi:hypothetical protein